MQDAKCVIHEDHVAVKPLWRQFTFHHLGLIISAIFGSIAIIISLWLILKHATHYSKPWEQKAIIRILFMIPIYATVSFLSYLYYRHAIYFEVLRDCYEAFAISSFFTLMCHYIAPNLHEQKEYFRNIEVKNWLWPMTWMQKCTGGGTKGWLRKPQSGLTWFNIVWISIFQYCFIRVFFTIVSVVTQATGRYCETSLDPRFARVWSYGFTATSVTIAMYCLIQFYYQLKKDLAPYRPFLKILCIKLVIFFCFWQTLLISLLATDDGPLKPTEQIARPDMKIGIPSMLICVEMAIFAALHVWAFSWKPYDLKRFRDPHSYTGELPKQYVCGPVRALTSVFNPWDIIKDSARGFRWLFVGARKRRTDVSYQTKLPSLSENTSYSQGPTFVGNGETATELAAPTKKHDMGKSELEDSDTAGLLSNVQANPYELQGSGTVKSSYELQGSHTIQSSYELPAVPFGSAPTGYVPAPRPGQEHGVVRPEAGKPSTEWDMFAGAKRPDRRRI
jgi:hypothetical protein